MKIALQEDVDEFMKKPECESAEGVLRSLEEQHNKYKFMEYNLITKKSRSEPFHCVYIFNEIFGVGLYWHQLFVFVRNHIKLYKIYVVLLSCWS